MVVVNFILQKKASFFNEFHYLKDFHLHKLFYTLVYSYFYYKNIIIDNTNINITPDIIGTAVLLMIFNGLTFNVPATINTTAATGETALNRFPARPIGTL